MNQMVAANRKAVAIARNNPYIQLWSGHLQPSCNRRCAAMDRMEAVSVHVVGEAARTSDAGNEHGVVARHTQLRHYFLHRSQDRVVTASGTPAYFLVGDEILAGKSSSHLRHPSNARVMRLMISLTLKGRPWILLTPNASTR